MTLKEVIAKWDSMNEWQRNEWVSTKIMRNRPLNENEYLTGIGCAPRYYTSIIELAFDVVDTIQGKHPHWRFSLLGGDRQKPIVVDDRTLDTGPLGKGWWKAEWFGEEDPEKDNGDRHGSAYAPTKEQAICLASLIAIEKVTP